MVSFWKLLEIDASRKRVKKSALIAILNLGDICWERPNVAKSEHDKVRLRAFGSEK